MRHRNLCLVLVGTTILIGSSHAASQKAGITASRFLDLTSSVQEIYIAGITDALDEADLLHCPAGVS